jgi:ribosomal protein S6--L-glutamate ligase
VTVKIALISRSEEIHSTRRLLEAGRARGHDMVLVPILESRLSMDQGHVLRVRGQPLSPVEAVIPRIGSFMPDLGLALLRFFERQGVRTLNGSQAIAHSRDKFETRATLLDLGLPVPKTIYVKDLEQISSSLDELGAEQVVLKPREGTQGRGVILAESRSSAASILEALLYLNREVLLEEYFSETRGCDLRLLVVGSEVVAAARRRAADGDFRSNLHQGGQLEPIEVDPDVGELARRATRGLDLEVAGVDILETHRGPVLLEVNAAPGLRGIERATGIDVAASAIEYLEGAPGE